jgi:hypothetical protein
MLYGYPPLARPLPDPPAPPKRQPEPTHSQRETDLLQALTDFCEAYEDSGYSSMCLGAAYLNAKRLLREAGR